MNNHLTSKEFMEKVSAIVEANLHNEQFGVAELADEMGMSRSSLHRKVKKAAKVSVNQYIRQARLKYALELLKTSSDTVSEVAYKSGFNSTSYFIKCFHDYYGYSPGEFGSSEQETEPDESNNLPKGQKKNRLRWLISIAALIVIVLTVINLSNFSLSGGKKQSDTVHIAVLPFVDDSPEEGNTYIVNGLMEEIINKLQKIDELRVKSRTDSEKYRDTKKSIAEIARELNVYYLLEGSGQVIGDEIKLRLQLIQASTGNHIWSKPYTEDTKDIFALQEDVALSVAEELEAIITPEEKELVENKPTENLAAYDLYLQGIELSRLAIYTSGREQKLNLVNRAKHLFKQAVELDSTFSGAYSYLAHIYIAGMGRFINSAGLREQILDSGLMMANKALKYDDQNRFAYEMRASYYAKKGDMDKARQNYSEADKYWDTDTWTEWGIYKKYFWRYFTLDDDFKALKNFYIYRELKPKNEIINPDMIYVVYKFLRKSGHTETAINYLQKFSNYNNVSLSNNPHLMVTHFCAGNYENSIEIALNRQKLVTDSTVGAFNLYILTISHLYLNNFEKALDNYNRLIQIAPLNSLKNMPGVVSTSKEYVIVNMYVGFAYLKTGNNEKAHFHFQNSIKRYREELNSSNSKAADFDSHFGLACIYSALNEKEKAIKHLEFLKKREQVALRSVTELKNNPMLDNVRNEPEFAKILKDQDEKFQSAHNKVAELIQKYER